MKQIVIAGNLGKDAQLRRTQNGDAVSGFSVAVESRAAGEKVTTWFDVSQWGKRAEALAPHLTKGSRVTVIGEFGTREHEGKTYLTVKASEITLQGGGNRDRHEPQGSAPAGGYGDGVPDDEIPF